MELLFHSRSFLCLCIWIFKYSFILILYIWCFAWVYFFCAPYVWNAHRSLKRVSAALELVLETVISFLVGVGNCTWVLSVRAVTCLNHWAISSSTCMYFKIQREHTVFSQNRMYSEPHNPWWDMVSLYLFHVAFLSSKGNESVACLFL